MERFQEKHRRDVPAGAKENMSREAEAAKTTGVSEGQGSEDVYAKRIRNLATQAEETVGILGNLPERIIPDYASNIGMTTTSTPTHTPSNGKSVAIHVNKRLIGVIFSLSQDIIFTHLAETSSLLKDMAVAHSALEEVDPDSATNSFHNLLVWVDTLRRQIVNENEKMEEEIESLRTHWEEYAAEVDMEMEMDDGVSDWMKARSKSEKEWGFGASSSQPNVAVLFDKTDLSIEAFREPNREHESTIVKDDNSSIAKVLMTRTGAVKEFNSKDAELKTEHTRDIEREPVTGVDIYNSLPAPKMGLKILSEEFRKERAIPPPSVLKPDCSNSIGTSKATFCSASFGNTHYENVGEVDCSKIAGAGALREKFEACKTEQEHWDAIGDAFVKMKETPLVRENEIPIPSQMLEAKSLHNETCKTEQHHWDVISNAFSDVFVNFQGDRISRTVRDAFNIVSPVQAPNVEVMDRKPKPVPIPEKKKKAHRGKRGGVKHHKRTQPSPQDMSNSAHGSLSNVEYERAGGMAEIKGKMENKRAMVNGMMVARPAVDKRIDFPLGREKPTVAKRVGLESKEMVRQGLLQSGNGKEEEGPSLRPTVTPHLSATPPVPVDQAISIQALRKSSGRLSQDPKFLATDSATRTLISASTPKPTTAHQRQTRAQTQETPEQDKQKTLPRVLDEEDELKNMIKLTDDVTLKMTIHMPVVEPSSSRAEATENTVFSQNLSKDQDMRKGNQEAVVSHPENSGYQDLEADTEREGVSEEWIEYAEDEEYQEIHLENAFEREREGEDDFVYLETGCEQSEEGERI